MFFVYIMRIKDEILPIFKAFKIWIEKQTKKQIKRIRANGELRSNAFDDWFEKTDIQWESSASNTPEQNDVIEREMYIIVGSIKAVHKTYNVFMKLWDFIIEKIVYTWNKIATTSFCRPEVTSFEMINEVKSNVSNLRVLSCRCYVHVLNTSERHKFDDHSWKEVLVGYEGHNQWKIYNSLNKKVHTSRDVRFDEKGSYYETDSSPPQCIIEKSKEEEMKQIWTESEDEEMNEAQRPPTASKNKYSISSDTKDSADTDEKKKFEDISERQLTSEQQKELIPREIMSSSSQSTSSRTISIKESVSTEQTNASSSLTFIKKQRNKTSLSSSSDKKIRTVEKETKRSNYNELNDLNRRRRKEKSNAGQTHMFKIFQALSVDEELKLIINRAARTLKLSIIEPQLYREARRSADWSHWKKTMKVKIVSHIENETWIFIKFSKDRQAITDRWMFKIKYDLNNNILKYKTRWIVHDYKQIARVDFNFTWAKIMKIAFFKTLFALTGARELYIYQMNVVTAFLYDFLDEIIYVNQSDNFIKNSTLICELWKTLYELRQSSRVWYKIIQKFLKGLSFIFIAADASVFVSENKKSYICVYVNDILFIDFDDEYLKSLKERLFKRFKMTDLKSISHYLKMLITRSNDRITLN